MSTSRTNTFSYCFVRSDSARSGAAACGGGARSSGMFGMRALSARCRSDSMGLDDLVDQPVFDRLVGLHVAVAVHVLVDLLERLAGVLGEDLVGEAAGVEVVVR